MESAEYSMRWSDPNFLSATENSLRSLFVMRKAVQNLDLRGVVVGLDGALAPLLNADFQDTNLQNVDLSHGKFSCAFSRASFQQSGFQESLFDTCRFKSARFHTCLF